MGSIPGRGTKMLHATTKKKKVFQGYLSIQMKEKDLKVLNVLH